MFLMISETIQNETDIHVQYAVQCVLSRVCLILPVLSQDIQGEVPSHLLRLKVEVERSRVAVILQDCRAELDREMHVLSGTCTSERVIKEHRVSPGFGRILEQIKPRVAMKEI